MVEDEYHFFYLFVQHLLVYVDSIYHLIISGGQVETSSMYWKIVAQV